MTAEEARREAVDRLMKRAGQALAAARREHGAADLDLAVNRVYYACFHAVSAVLLQEERVFVKPSGVRAELHRHLVKSGRVAAELGRFYDAAFDARHEADHGAGTTLDAETVLERIVTAERFVAERRRLLPWSSP